MRKLSVMLTVLLLAACSPQVYPLYLDVRQPSSSGLDLSRKTLSMVYMEGKDSVWDHSVASALVRSLEEDYFGGEEVMGLYHIPSADSVSLDTMHSLVMDTDGDVVFVLSSHLEMPADTSGVMTVPLSTSLAVYDSMGEDKVNRYSGSTVLQVNGMRELNGKADEMAGRMVSRFLSGWKTERFSFYYFDGANQDWYSALGHVSKGEMARAMDLWMPFVKGRDVVKSACAAYNLAMAFYLMEDFEMSGRWLDFADKLENLSLSSGLRTRLNERKK